MIAPRSVGESRRVRSSLYAPAERDVRLLVHLLLQPQPVHAPHDVTGAKAHGRPTVGTLVVVIRGVTGPRLPPSQIMLHAPKSRSTVCALRTNAPMKPSVSPKGIFHVPAVGGPVVS